MIPKTGLPTAVVRHAGLLSTLVFVASLPACRRAPTAEEVTLHLIDHFRYEMVDGAPTEVREPEPLGLWDFSQPPAASQGEAPETLGWKVGAGVSNLTLREGRLTGRTGTDTPIIFVKRTDRLDEPDQVHSVEIRMRVSQGANLSLSTAGAQEPNFSEMVQLIPLFAWPDTTPILAGEDFQTYTLRLVNPGPASQLQHLLIRPTDAAGADFEIESVRLISRKEYLARVPSGVGWHGLSDVYRETLVSRSPETIGMEVQLPDDPWLDLHIGTIEDGPVTFKVRLGRAGSNGAGGELLLERTLTRPHRWEPVPLDLAAWAGRRVSLALSVEAAEPGALGFWGGPVVRARIETSPAARREPPVHLTSGGRPPQGVIVIIGDTLRKDHLSFHGYHRETAPVLSRMAGEGALFLDNVVQATWTKVSVPSIMTSLYPLTHGVRNFTDRLPASAATLAEVFRKGGYATTSYSSVLFSGRFTNLHQGFEALHEASSLPDRDRRSSKTAREYVDRLCAWLEVHRDVPFFAFLHVFDPHDPYQPYSPYDAQWADIALKEEREAMGEKVKEVIEDPFLRGRGMPTRQELQKAGIDPQDFLSLDIDWYDGSIRAMDAEVGRLMERLRSLGLADRTLVVFTSDHGEEFLEHDRMFHGQSVYGELTNVPLLFHYPGVIPPGLVIDETVASIDIMPTILELSHLPVPEDIQGRSLLPLMAAARDMKEGRGSTLDEVAARYGWSRRAVFSEKAEATHRGSPPPRDLESYAVILDGWKLIHNIQAPDDRPEFELFRHAEDPLNLENVGADHPEVVDRLRAEIDSWRETTLAARLPEEVDTQGLSPEELERLRGLGYIQ